MAIVGIGCDTGSVVGTPTILALYDGEGEVVVFGAGTIAFPVGLELVEDCGARNVSSSFCTAQDGIRGSRRGSIHYLG